MSKSFGNKYYLLATTTFVCLLKSLSDRQTYPTTLAAKVDFVEVYRYCCHATDKTTVIIDEILQTLCY